jgi:hypothetical protein
MEKEFDYKIKQLQLMLDSESNFETGGYGANLSHWSGTAKPINIDAGALQCLIDYYTNKNYPDVGLDFYGRNE